VRINLKFELDSELDVENSLHKVDVLAAALAEFRWPRRGGSAGQRRKPRTVEPALSSPGHLALRRSERRFVLGRVAWHVASAGARSGVRIATGPTKLRVDTIPPTC
jgi:hypothetical protein